MSNKRINVSHFKVSESQKSRLCTILCNYGIETKKQLEEMFNNGSIYNLRNLGKKGVQVLAQYIGRRIKVKKQDNYMRVKARLTHAENILEMLSTGYWKHVLNKAGEGQYIGDRIEEYWEAYNK